MSLSPDIIAHGIESWKLWSFLITTFITIVIGAYRAFQWVKGIRTEDLVEVKQSLTTVTTEIRETSAAQLRSTEFQTQSLVRELSELRGIMYGAFAAPQMAPARKRAIPKRRKKDPIGQLTLDTKE